MSVKRIKPVRKWIMRLQRYMCFTGIHINPDGSVGGYITSKSFVDDNSFTTRYTYIIDSDVSNSIIEDSVIIGSNITNSSISKCFVKGLCLHHRCMENKVMIKELSKQK